MTLSTQVQPMDKKANKRHKKKKYDKKKRNQHKAERIEFIRNEFTQHCKDVVVFFRRRMHIDTETYKINNTEIQKTAKRIYKGIVVVVDADTYEPVLVVPFNKVPNEQLQYLCSFFQKLKKHSNEVRNNGAHQHGRMYATGHRKDMSADHFAGTYMPAPKTQRSSDLLSDWEQLMYEHSQVEQIYRDLFFDLSPKLFDTMIESGKIVPSLGQLELDQESIPFASNLTWTDSDFWNSLHVDRDANPYAYGIWFSTEDDHIIGDTALTGCENGHFFVPEYNVYVDFGNNTTEIIWRGRSDLHCTTPSKRHPNCHRVGTSIQVSQKLVNAFKKYYDTPAPNRPLYKGLQETLKLIFSKNK